MIKDKPASIPSVKPDETDLQMMADMETDSDDTTTSLEKVRKKRECSGKILLRIPKELHLDLIEMANQEGVSLNQYCLYKLARGIEASY